MAHARIANPKVLPTTWETGIPSALAVVGLKRSVHGAPNEPPLKGTNDRYNTAPRTRAIPAHTAMLTPAST